MQGLVETQLQASDTGMVRHEGQLEGRGNLQQPIELVGIAVLTAVRPHPVEAGVHHARHLHLIVDDDAIALLRRGAQRQPDELMQLREVVGGRGRAGEDHRHRLFGIGRVEQDAEQVEYFLGSPHTAREHHDTVAQPHEGLQTLLDVRQDDQRVDDGIGWLGSHDARLRQPDETAVVQTLLGVSHRGPLHGAFHGARAAARAHRESTQPQFVAHALGVVVFLATNAVAAPANHEIGTTAVFQYAGVAQDAEHGIRDVVWVREVETAAGSDLVAGVDDVAQHGEQVFLHTTDHASVHERRGRRMREIQLHAPRLTHQPQVERGIALEEFTGIITVAATVQHRERATTKQGIKTALPHVEQLGDFLLRQVFEHTTGRHPRVDEVAAIGAARKMQRGIHGHGRISTGIRLRVSNQISSMSSLFTAMQPLVQSMSR